MSVLHMYLLLPVTKFRIGAICLNHKNDQTGAERWFLQNAKHTAGVHCQTLHLCALKLVIYA